VNKLLGATQREGLTIVPLKVYFNEKGRAKVEIALARGKKLHDKRETERERSWNRDRARLMREKG
jgi:SsrA-binding protein